MSSGKYSYDRRKQAMGPASRFKDAEQYLNQGNRQIEQAKAVLHGLVKEMEIVAKHTSDHTIKTNFEHVQQFAHQLDALDHQLDKLIADMDHASRSFH